MSKYLQEKLEDAISHYSYVIDELQLARNTRQIYEEKTGLKDDTLTKIEIAIKVLESVKDAYNEQLIDEYNANDDE